MALTDGSEAHHVTMQEFHRQAIAQLQDLQENTGSATPSRRVETEGSQTFEATGVADTHRVRAGGNVSGAEECQTATVGDVRPDRTLDAQHSASHPLGRILPARSSPSLACLLRANFTHRSIRNVSMFRMPSSDSSAT